MGNPAIFPFFRATETEDVLIVQINPVERTRDAAHADRDHEPHQRNHLQLLAARRIPRDRFRHPADRSGQAAARHGAGRVPPHQRAPHRARLDVQEARPPARSSIRTSISSRCCTRAAGARRGNFLTAHFDDIGVRSTVDLRRGEGRVGVIPPRERGVSGDKLAAHAPTPPHSFAESVPSATRSTSSSPTSRRSPSTPSSTPRTARCSAAAGSTARSIARPGRSCSRSAARSAAARPARPRSRAATGCRRST